MISPTKYKSWINNVLLNIFFKIIIHIYNFLSLFLKPSFIFHIIALSRILIKLVSVQVHFNLYLTIYLIIIFCLIKFLLKESDLEKSFSSVINGPLLLDSNQ